MIGSALSRISMADKLSIPQLQQAIQDGTVPAYVGVPLLQDKINQTKQSQALAAAPAAQPPIAQQVMQEAQGLSAARSNLPEFTAFDGGIVAFAGGDLVDDEEDDTDEDRADRAYVAQHDALMKELIAGYQGADYSMLGAPSAPSPMAPAEGAGIAAAPQVSAPVSEGIAAVAPATGVTLSSAKEEHRAGLKVPSGHKYEKEIIREAERLGISPELATKIAVMESGGHKSPESATSRAGARGIMQLMPGTAKEMGVTDITDPEQNIRGGLGYFKRMLDKYGDPKLAGAAYNWGPGNVDRWLREGADPSRMPTETRKYIASLKEGGEVKHFQAGGFGEDYSATDIYSGLPQQSDYATQMKKAFGFFPEYVGSLLGAPGSKPLVSPKAAVRSVIPPTLATAATPEARALQKQYEAQDIQEGEARQAPVSETLEAVEKATEEAKKPAEEPKDTFAEYLKRREEALAKRSEEDKYMSILAAGLGMMGGTSPYAAANIGAGAMKGIETAAALSKERGLQERALMRGQLEQARAQETAGVRKTLAKQAEEAKFITGMSSVRKDVMSKIAKARGQVLESIDDPKLLAKIEQETDAYLSKDPGYQRMYQSVYGVPYRGTSGTDYSRWGGLNVSKK